MKANKELFLPMLMSVVEMAIPDAAMLQKVKHFTKDGELVYELLSDLMSADKEGKASYWIERLYGFIKQGALSLEEQQVQKLHQDIVSAIDKLVSEVKSKHKCEAVTFSLSYFKGKAYLQLAEVRAKKGGMDFRILSSCTLKKAIFVITNAIRQSDTLETAWQTSLAKLFPEFATIQLPSS